jgi:hypothetical protein
MPYAGLLWSLEARLRQRMRRIDDEAEIAIERGEIIDDVHHAGRSLPTRIYLDHADGRAIHVVVAYDDGRSFARVITVYEPTLDRWMPGCRERRRHE